MPPPRHPVSADPSPADAPNDAQASEPAAVPAGPRKPPPNRPRAAPATVEPTFKVTLYIDRDTDDFMEATRVEGLTSRPKVDISRSAVVRLALRRLMDEMSPAEVKTHLERQAVRDGGPGRKRR